MSFDVFAQGFANGQARDGGGELARAVLAPCATEHLGALVITVGDGSADVYLDDDGFLANHITGADPWELLVRAAAAADWVILPVGCPTCLTDESQRGHLPEPLQEKVKVVRQAHSCSRWSSTSQVAAAGDARPVSAERTSRSPRFLLAQLLALRVGG